jgi:DNA-binding CsgD family transcriptional regulator
MAEENYCPLSYTLLEILATCVRLNRVDTWALAHALHRSSRTMRTGFKRIFQALGVQSRHQAVMKATEAGWVPPSPLDRLMSSKLG